MLTKTELDELLEILATLILSNNTYKKIYQRIHTIKTAKGSFYIQISEDGLSKLSLVLNEDYLETADRVTIYTHINRMTQDFSALSAISNANWYDLAELLITCHGRVTEPDIFLDNKRSNPFASSNSHKAMKAIVQLMLDNPWVMLILLIEITYIKV